MNTPDLVEVQPKSPLIEHKILLAGPMGAGKTTAITALSDGEIISTDVKSFDQSESTKATTTVGFDYGKIQIDERTSIRLIGTPGQERFSFMWPALAIGAVGLVILLDVQRPDPTKDLAMYLDRFSDLTDRGLAVIGLSKCTDEFNPDTFKALQEVAIARPVALPLLVVDVRDKMQALILLELLLMQIEINANAENTTEQFA
jgi:uncharacterized protein